MKPNHWFPAFFLASSLLFAGCYTHLATSGGGYYVYHPRPVYSDTLRSAPKEIVTYDTTMHGDTMFIDEHRTEATSQGNGLAESIAPNENGNTIINNYYGSASYWDSYWGPSWGFSVGFGWPYYNTWYSPWWPYYYTPNYYTDWWEPYGYFGYYPPVYNAFYGYPHYPYYGGYGHHHYFHDGYYGHDYGVYSNVLPGRIGGEHRIGGITNGQNAPGIIATNRAEPSATLAPSRLAEANASEMAQSNASDVIRSADDRNAPVHVLSPDAESARGGAPAAAVTAPAGMAAPTARASAAQDALTASSNSRPIIVRRMDNGQTVTTSTVNRSGRQMVVVRRSSGYNAAAAYRGSYGNGASSRAYAPSSRNSGNYSAPARSYSPPERGSAPSERNSSTSPETYSPPERSYSPPQQSYSPPERSAPPENSGRSYGGGSEGRAGGGGEGRAR